MNTPFEKRICFTICICQMVAVLSCVSIVYLTVAVYKPAYQTLNSGFLEETVMCTTVMNKTPTECDQLDGRSNDELYKGWNSCSEWCLSKSAGNCPRIYVDVRVNGSNIRLEGCEFADSILCSGVDPLKKPIECVTGECNGISGFYNCTSPKRTPGTASDLSYGAKCVDLSNILVCNYTQYDDIRSCETKEGCLELNGTYNCNVGNCKRILPPYNCHKNCVGIKTGNKTVIIREGDRIFSAQCQRAVNMSDETEIWPLKHHMSTKNPDVPKTLFMFCTNMLRLNDNQSYEMSDCFNGTLLEPNYFGETTEIIKLQDTHYEYVDRAILGMSRDDILVGPAEPDLLIFNSTRLFINYESCVNTLILDECAKFYAEYGGDGSDLRSNSRFQCHYAPDFSDFVTLRYSKMKTMTELMIATSVPMTLALLSCCSLVICSRIIHVGDDSHFYFQCCGNKEEQAVIEKEQGNAMAL